MHFFKAWFSFLVLLQSLFVVVTSNGFGFWTDQECQKFCNKNCDQFFSGNNGEWFDCKRVNDKCNCGINPPTSKEPPPPPGADECEKYCNRNCDNFKGDSWLACQDRDKTCDCNANPPKKKTEPEPEPSFPHWKIIAIVLGSVAALFLIGGICAYCICCRRPQRNNVYGGSAVAPTDPAPAWGVQTQSSTYQSYNYY